MSYETQFKKFVAKRFNIDINRIARISEYICTRDIGGCPTCGPEYKTTIELSIVLTDGSTVYKEIDISYGDGFVDMLTDIIEA